MGTLCSITNVFKDADGKFQVFLVKTEGDQIQTQVLAPLNENGTVDFSLKNPSVFLNGAELVYNSDYSLTSWEDTTDGKKKVQVNAMGDLTFKEKDYVLVWMQSKLGAEDIQFTSGQKITSTKLNQIFQALFNKLEELRSAGFAFASNTLFSKLAEGLQVVLDQYTQDKETELDNYVDNTLKPDLDNYTEQKKDEINDTAAYLDVDKVDGKDASDFTPIDHDTATQGVHGIVTPYFIAKTSREDQFPDWMDVQNKPSTYPPSPHQHGDSDLLGIDWSKVQNKPFVLEKVILDDVNTTYAIDTTEYSMLIIYYSANGSVVRGLLNGNYYADGVHIIGQEFKGTSIKYNDTFDYWWGIHGQAREMGIRVHDLENLVSINYSNLFPTDTNDGISYLTLEKVNIPEPVTELVLTLESYVAPTIMTIIKVVK